MTLSWVWCLLPALLSTLCHMTLRYGLYIVQALLYVLVLWLIWNNGFWWIIISVLHLWLSLLTWSSSCLHPPPHYLPPSLCVLPLIPFPLLALYKWVIPFHTQGGASCPGIGASPSGADGTMGRGGLYSRVVSSGLDKFLDVISAEEAANLVRFWGYPHRCWVVPSGLISTQNGDHGVL